MKNLNFFQAPVIRVTSFEEVPSRINHFFKRLFWGIVLFNPLPHINIHNLFVESFSGDHPLAITRQVNNIFN